MERGILRAPLFSCEIRCHSIYGYCQSCFFADFPAAMPGRLLSFFKRFGKKNLFLLAVSYLFYAFSGLHFVFLLLGLSLLTYFFAKKNWAVAGILLNLGCLAIFKYLNFGIENVTRVLQILGIQFSPGFIGLGMPLGLSFFIFKHIGYLLDVSQKRYPASTNLWVFLTYAAYFPQISSGPISSYADTAPQFSQLPEKPSSEQIQASLIQLTVGLAKKILIADSLASYISSQLDSLQTVNGLIPAWYLVIAFAARLYFDFSGYTDIVLGVSGLFGVKLPQNFHNPYLASNPGEFWERWHISLSQWFRYYLFSPLSRFFLKRFGSNRREFAQYAANIITMALVGLWHGAAWSYVVWGVYHGILLNLNAWWKRTGRSLPVWIGKPLFLMGILLGWALFMLPDTKHAVHLASQMVGLHGLGQLSTLFSLLQQQESLVLFFGISLAFSGVSEANQIMHKKFSPWQLVLWGASAAICLLFITQEITFIYAQF